MSAPPDLTLAPGYEVEVDPPLTLEVVRPTGMVLTVEAPEVTALVVQPDVDLTPDVQRPPNVDLSVAVVPVPGPPGPAGGGYSHHQTNPAAQWTIHHHLGQYREPTLLLDTAPTVPVWADVEHLSADLTVITLPEPATGWAYL